MRKLWLLPLVMFLGILAYSPSAVEVIDPVENAKELLLDFYADLTIHKINASQFNKPLKTDGRFAAILTSSGQGYIKVVDIRGKRVKELFVKELDASLARRISVGFSNNGDHIICAWSEKGRGSSSNIEIYDTAESGMAPVFSLSRVESLSIVILDDNSFILSQRWPNMINNDPSIHPAKANYFILSYDEILGEYRLESHLRKLPNERMEVGARLNNQAIDHYRNGNLKKARDLLEKVVNMLTPGIKVSRLNLIMVNREIEALEMQKVKYTRALVSSSFDDARLSFFTGNYRDCINQITAKSKRVSGDKMVMLAVCYVQTGLWGDLAIVDRVLLRADPNFRKEYLSYLVDVIEAEGNILHFTEYLKKLEAIDEYHPNLIAHKARLLVKDNRRGDARLLLDRYLEQFYVPPSYRAKLALIRWEIASIEGDKLKMREMEEELVSLPKPDLSYIVEMLNYESLEPETFDIEYPIDEVEEPDLTIEFFSAFGD